MKKLYKDIKVNVFNSNDVSKEIVENLNKIEPGNNKLSIYGQQNICDDLIIKEEDFPLIKSTILNPKGTIEINQQKIGAQKIKSKENPLDIAPAQLLSEKLGIKISINLVSDNSSENIGIKTDLDEEEKIVPIKKTAYQKYLQIANQANKNTNASKIPKMISFVPNNYHLGPENDLKIEDLLKIQTIDFSVESLLKSDKIKLLDGSKILDKSSFSTDASIDNVDLCYDLKNVGGVDMKVAKIRIDKNMNNLTGVYINPDTNQICLVQGNNLTNVNLNIFDLATALKIVSGHSLEPSFSLDPNDPKTPDGPWMRKVYYPDERIHTKMLEGTSLGDAMFEADWLLKQHSLGIKVVQENPLITEDFKYPTGFKSLVDSSFSSNSQWTRLWIVIDYVNLYCDPNDKDLSLVFAAYAKLSIQGRNMKPDPVTGILKDVESHDLSEGDKYFVEYYSAHFDELCQIYPEYNRMKECAKAVALAKWIKAKGVKIDMDAIDKILSKYKPAQKSKLVPTLRKSTEFQEERNGEKYIVTRKVLGGVDFTVKMEKINMEEKPTAEIYTKMKCDKLSENLNFITLPFTVRHKCIKCEKFIQPFLENFPYKEKPSDTVSSYYCLMHDPRKCAGCGMPCLVGNFWTLNSEKFHENCFNCCYCLKKLEDKFASLGNGYFHDKCSKMLLARNTEELKRQMKDGIKLQKKNSVIKSKGEILNDIFHT